MACPTCEQAFWGKRDVEGVYCSLSCAETGRVGRRAQDIAPELVAREVARLRAAPCERCARRRSIEAHRVYIGDRRDTIVSCKRCAMDEQASAIFSGSGGGSHPAASASLDLMFWFLPFSVADILAWVFNAVLNLWAMATRFASRKPSSDLRRVVAERLAAAQLEAERDADLAQMRRDLLESLLPDSGNAGRSAAEAKTSMPGKEETIRRRRREAIHRGQD